MKASDILVFGKTNSNPYKNAAKLSIAPDNFYLINDSNGKPKIAPESASIIYNEDLFDTKYYPIMLKRWAYALKDDGLLHLRIDIEKKDMSKMLGEITRWSHHHFALENYTEDENYLDVRLRKNTPNEPADDVNRWTFGIVTLGKKNDVVEKIIASIRAQKIPEYEIIICGTYYDRKEPDCRYIHFNEQDDRGWTTRKKNVICENAKYPNIMVVHDRIALHKDWFKGMRKFGNNWEALSCVMNYKNYRAYDWITTRYKYTEPKSRHFRGGYMEYSDWDEWTYLDGGAAIVKRSAWQKVPWPEDRFYGEAEDLKFSHQQSCAGILISFNPYAKWESLSFNHPPSKLMIRKDDKKLGTHKGPLHLMILKKLQGAYYAIGSLIFGKIRDPEKNLIYRRKK